VFFTASPATKCKTVFYVVVGEAEQGKIKEESTIPQALSR